MYGQNLDYFGVKSVGIYNMRVQCVCACVVTFVP